MFLLIFEDHVRSTVELITAIPKFYREPKRFHYDLLRNAAFDFACTRIIGMVHYIDGVKLDMPDPYPLHSTDKYSLRTMEWKHWAKKGVAYDESQDWFIKAVDTDIGYPGMMFGPQWNGIKCIPTPVPLWLEGGEELRLFQEIDEEDDTFDLQEQLDHDKYNDGGKTLWPKSHTERQL